MLKSLKWRMSEVPFAFKVVRPSRFLRHIRPLRTSALRRAVRFVLGRPQLFLITSSDTRLLPSILTAAATAPADGVPSDAEMEADVAALGVRPLFDGAELERI